MRQQRHAEIAVRIGLRDARQSRQQLRDDRGIEAQVGEKNDDRGITSIVEQQFEHRLDQIRIVEDLGRHVDRIARSRERHQLS